MSDIASDGFGISPEKFIRYGIDNSLVESELGTCTLRHRNVVYANGYEHRVAINLARLASRLVDAPKGGLQLRPDKWGATLNALKTTEPEYVKPVGERRNVSSGHVMDVLVLQVIPAFRDHLLISFNKRVERKDKMPMDIDIKAFYDQIRQTYPEVIKSLRASLSPLQQDWDKWARKLGQKKSQSKDDITCSPRKRIKRSETEFWKSELVLDIFRH